MNKSFNLVAWKLQRRLDHPSCWHEPPPMAVSWWCDIWSCNFFIGSKWQLDESSQDTRFQSVIIHVWYCDNERPFTYINYFKITWLFNCKWLNKWYDECHIKVSIFLFLFWPKKAPRIIPCDCVVRWLGIMMTFLLRNKGVFQRILGRINNF